MELVQNELKEKEHVWMIQLENERKCHEDSIQESVTTFYDLEEKMKEYEEISMEIKQISADISVSSSLTVSAAENIKNQVRKKCYSEILICS